MRLVPQSVPVGKYTASVEECVRTAGDIREVADKLMAIYIMKGNYS